MSFVNFSTLASSFKILVFHVSSTSATTPYLGDVGLGEEYCAVLPFLESGFQLFHCFFRDRRELSATSTFVAFAAFIQSALSSKDTLSDLSSPREPRCVEEREFFGFRRRCAHRHGTCLCIDGIFGFVKPLLICRGLGFGSNF